MFKLSPRLQLIYDQLLPGKPVWDFCCDHGHIGLMAHVSENFSEVHFVDQAAHLVKRIEQRFMDKFGGVGPWEGVGFHPYAGEQVPIAVTGNAVIAGVGGLNIKQILEGLAASKHLNADRLILAPHRDLEAMMESTVLKDFFVLERQVSVVENGRKRFIFVYGPAKADTLAPKP